MTYQATQVFSGHDIRVVVIESVSSGVCQVCDSCVYVTGHVNPVAIIVLGPDSSHAVDMDATVMGIQAMHRQIPDLLELIQPFIDSITVEHARSTAIPSSSLEQLSIAL